MATILIVEDENQVRVFAESYLQQLGHRTLSAATAEEARVLIDAVDGVDVLFSEIKLKDDEFAGVRVAKQAARRWPRLKIVYAAERHVNEGLKSLLVAPAAVLAKPYTIGDLNEGIKAQL